MYTLTAHILIGPGNLDGLRIPTHALYLIEQQAPTWSLVPTGIDPQGSPAAGRLDWTPTTENLLEDGLLMLGLHVEGFPELQKRADQWFTRSWRGEVNLACDIAIDPLKELHAMNREQEWQQHLVITVLSRCEAIERLHVLRQYHFGMDLCSFRAGRYKTAEGFNPVTCDLSPFSFHDDDDDAPLPDEPF